MNDIINKSLNPATLKINNKVYAHNFNRGLFVFYFSTV